MCALIPSFHSWRKHRVPTLTEFLNAARFGDTALCFHHQMHSASLLARCTAKEWSATAVFAKQGKACKGSSTSGMGCWREEAGRSRMGGSQATVPMEEHAVLPWEVQGQVQWLHSHCTTTNGWDTCVGLEISAPPTLVE